MHNCGTASPAQGVPRHQTQQQGFGRYPTGKPAKTGYIPQSLNSLLQFEMPQILLHNVRHSHAKASGKILNRHLMLLGRILQKIKQAFGQSLRTPRSRVKLDRQFLGLRHLPEVCDVCADDGYSVCAS
jgi:hypothetical protein